MDKQAILNHFKDDFIRFYSKYLVDLQQAGKEYKARCPFHDDKTPSLSINPDLGLFHCFGCGAKGDIFKFYGKLNGLDAFPVILSGIATDFGISNNMTMPQPTVVRKNGDRLHAKKRKLVSTDYLDLQGQLQFQKLRYDPKNFSLRRPDNCGSWINHIKGIEPVLYNLSAVLMPTKCV